MLEREGLDPHDYHLRALQGLVRNLRQTPNSGDAGELAALELLLSDAFLSAALHLKTGRLQPVAKGSKSHQLHVEMARHLERGLSARTLASTLQNLIPTSPAYTSLRQALAQYRQIADRGGWTTIPRGPAMKLGTHSERVPMLRSRLLVTDDLKPGIALELEDTDPHRFDARLAQAVKQFQARHGLAVDGTVGPRTRAALNVPAEARVRQIMLNMERLRRQGQAIGDRHIVVNIPDYQLHVMEKGQSVLNMRVVVGKPSWQTPTFQSTMTISW